MVRSIATRGAELGWRGQQAWEKEFSRLQYQALRKATSAVQDTAIDKVNRMAGVEDVVTHLNNGRTRFVARCVEDPTKLGDIMPVGFGDEMQIDDELAEEGEGRRWLGKVRILSDADDIHPAGEASLGGSMPEGRDRGGGRRAERAERTAQTNRRVGKGNWQDRGRGFIHLLGRQPSGRGEHGGRAFVVRSDGWRESGVWDWGHRYGVGRRGGWHDGRVSQYT